MLFPLRLGAALVSALLTASALWNLAYAFWKLTPCGESFEDGCFEAYEALRQYTAALQWVWGFLWMGAWVWLEVRARRSDDPRLHARLLGHLRYGPLAALAFSILFVLAYDAALVQHSRWQLVRYIRVGAVPSLHWTPELHNDYRGFCGNGISERVYELYGETVANEFDSPDPDVRARALSAGQLTYDWFNDPRDGPFVEMVRKGLTDSDPTVRRVAADFHAQLYDAPPPSCRFRF